MVPQADDRDLLVAAAWLHDIGYGARVRDTGFHPLDGARFLQANGWPDRVCALVAYHSGARYVAEVLGLAAELAAFPDEGGALADALTWADQTTGPEGQALTVGARIADMLRRHGPDSPNARVHPERGPYIHDVVARVERGVSAP